MLIKKIYFRNNVQHIKILIICDKKSIGLLHGIINEDNCNINVLNVKNEFQNNGLGSMLIQELINYCSNNDIKNITLDDMSDRFNQSHNIYMKFNFKYIMKGFPEMILYV